MIIDLNNNLSLKVIIYPLLIFLSLLIIHLPNNIIEIDQFNYTDFDTKNNQEESNSSYELELDDFIYDKNEKSAFYSKNLYKNIYKINHPKLIYLDTPNPPPELV